MKTNLYMNLYGTFTNFPEENMLMLVGKLVGMGKIKYFEPYRSALKKPYIFSTVLDEDECEEYIDIETPEELLKIVKDYFSSSLRKKINEEGLMRIDDFPYEDRSLVAGITLKVLKDKDIKLTANNILNHPYVALFLSENGSINENCSKTFLNEEDLIDFLIEKFNRIVLERLQDKSPIEKYLEWRQELNEQGVSTRIIESDTYRLAFLNHLNGLRQPIDIDFVRDLEREYRENV